MADAAYAIARTLNVGADTDTELDTVGILITNAIKLILSRPGSGRIYGTHQASAPGEPPAVDTGVYRASWQWDRDTNKVRVFSHGAQPFERPEWLEFGNSRIKPRPHVRPAVAQTAPLIPPVIGKAIVARERAQARKERIGP